MLLASRAEDLAAESEYGALLRHGGLEPDELVRVRLEAGPMPALDLDELSGVIVGGSPFDSSAPEDHKSDVQRRVEQEMSSLLDVLVARDFPFLGACYGVGTLGTHEGGVIDATYAEPIGAVPVTLTPAGRADPLLDGLPGVFEAFVGHKEACRTLPENAVLLASSPLCPVQMFRVGTSLYATQFHPELDPEGVATRVQVYREYGYFEPNEADELIARTAHANVGAVHRIVRNFVARYART